METTRSPRFADVLQEHVSALQDALRELSASIDADLSVPYPLSKRLGIDKNLTWKAARILQAGGPTEALKHLPGKSGRELFLDAFKRAGAPLQRVDAVSRAVSALEATVLLHTDDKATLELVLDGIPQKGGELLETSRKLAFRGNSGIWGVQARTRLTSVFLAPTAGDDDLVDLALVAGFFRFRRLREETPWPILKLRHITHEGEAQPPSPSEPLDEAGVLEGGPSLLTDFSTDPAPPIRSYETRTNRVIELPEGPIGNPGAVDLVFGERFRGFAPRWAETAGETAEHQSDVDLPVEHLQFDLFVHRSLPLAKAPTFQLLGRLGRDVAPAGDRRKADALPIHEEIVSIEPSPRDLKTDWFPRYPELIESVSARCGWNPSDFRVLRVTMDYPPAPTTAVILHELPVR